MKILIVNKYWYVRGGAERVVFATKKVLEQNGHEVEIFGMKCQENIVENKYFIENINYSKLKGLNKIKYSFKMLYNFDAKNKFTKLVEEFQPDVVHFHNIYHQLSFSLLDVLKKKNIPSVMTLHDYKMISPNYNLFHHGKIDEKSCGNSYYKCLLNNCMESFSESFLVTYEAYLRKWKKWKDIVSVYISPSVFLKDKFVSVGFENKIEVIPNPLDSVIDDDIIVGKYVLFMGRLSEEKGVKNVLKIAKKLPNIEFKIVGDGPLKRFLKENIEIENIKNVEILGYQSGDVLLDTLKKSRFLIMPSVWYENYPLSVLEAHSFGKIVLANSLGGLLEMIPKDMLVDSNSEEAWTNQIHNWYYKKDADLKETAKVLRVNVLKENSLDLYYKRLLKIYNGIIK